MNCKFFLSLFFLAVSSCQTAQTLNPVSFQKFSVQKLTDDALSELTFESQSQLSWPSVSVTKREGLAVNSQSISFAVVGSTHSDGQSWAYPKIAESLSREKIDFVIHTGDYVNQTENWQSWWSEFYQPSQGLLRKFPVLFLGGHSEPEFLDDQWIEIGDLIFINFDTSNIANRELTRRRLSEINSRLESYGKKKKEVWLLTHEPVMAYLPSLEDAEPVKQNETFKTLLSELGLLSKVDYVLSGHINNQQIVISDPNIKQFIIGNSGAKLKTFGRRILSESVLTTTDTNVSFGYAIFQRRGFKKWDIVYKNENAESTLQCEVSGQTIKCDP